MMQRTAKENAACNINRIFETKHSAKQSDHDWEKINIYCSWSIKFNIWCIHAIPATFLTRIYITAFVFEFSNSALTHWLLCRLWRALVFHFWRHHFWPKLASSILNFCRWKRSFQYTTFIMADTAIGLDRVAWKRGQKGQKIALRLFLYTMVSSSTFLTKNDIPGASLLGRKPEELKISELKV